MTEPGEYSDLLRALGRLLDDVQAFGIEVFDQGDQWAATWDRPGTIWLKQFELEALREVARMNRGLGDEMPRLTTSQILRVLGRVLDDAGATSFNIKEIDEGYRLTIKKGDEQTVKIIPLEEIRQMLVELLTAR